MHLNALADLGVAGFRIDAAKHLPTEHILAVLERVEKNVSIFAEIITYGGDDSIEYKLFLGPYLEATDHQVYDFPLLAKLRNVFKGNEGMQGLIRPQVKGQAVESSRAITMATNHDTANNPFDYFVMDEAQESLAYAYVLGNGQGTPLVYSESQDPGRQRWRDLHRRNDIVKMNDVRKKMQTEDLTYLYADSCLLVFRRGQSLVALNKCGSRQVRNFPTRDWPENSEDLQAMLSNNASLQVEGTDVEIGLDSHSFQFWIQP